MSIEIITLFTLLLILGIGTHISHLNSIKKAHLEVPAEESVKPN